MFTSKFIKRPADFPNTRIQIRLVNWLQLVVAFIQNKGRNIRVREKNHGMYDEDDKHIHSSEMKVDSTVQNIV